MVERTRKGGGEVVNLLGTSAWYAPGAAVAQMVDSIVLDQKRVLPCTACSRASTGSTGSTWASPSCSAPAGIERVIELDLDADEQAELERPRTRSARSWRSSPA